MARDFGTSTIETNTEDKLPENYLACPLEYMAFPKMTAYSEVAWSEMRNRNWNCFANKYSIERKILDMFNIKYRNKL